jgi:hypothetical protein
MAATTPRLRKRLIKKSKWHDPFLASNWQGTTFDDIDWKSIRSSFGCSPKGNNSNFLSTPTTGLQHCTSEPPKTTVSTDAVLPAEHGGKILTMSYAAQMTDKQWHETRKKLNSSIT